MYWLAGKRMRTILLAVLVCLLPASALAQEELTVTKIYSPTVTDLTLLPGSDVILAPVGNDVLPGTGYTVNLGRLTKKYLTLHAAELWVETLVAQNTLATIGGRVLVAPTNLLAEDFSASGVSGVTPFVTKYNNLTAGETIYMESDGKVEFFVVAFGPVGTGPYTYLVNRNQDGSGNNDWYAGDAILNTGVAGNGFIDLYSVRGIRAGTEIGPTIVGNVRTGSGYVDWEPRWAIGNLDGLYGYTGSTYGTAFGTPGAQRLTIDSTNGIVMYGSDNDPKVTIDTSGNATFDGKLTVGTGRNILRNSECRVGTEDWSAFTNSAVPPTMGYALSPWRLNDESSTCYFVNAGTPANGTLTDAHLLGQPFPVTAGTRYEASVYVGLHRLSSSYLYIAYFNSAGANISNDTGSNVCVGGAGGGIDLSGYCRTGLITTAPSTATSARFIVRAVHSGLADPYLFWVRAYFGEASTTQEDLTEWGPAGVTEITEGMIKTNAIITRTLAADSVTSAKIVAGTIVASDIAAGSITADRLTVSSLDAISANLGTIIAGSITGVTISGSTVYAGGSNEVTLNGSGITISNGTGTNNRIKWGSNIFMYGTGSGLLWLDANEIFLAVSGGGANVTVSGGVFQAQNGATFYNAVHHVAFQGSGSNRFVCHDNDGLLYSSGTTCDGSEPATDTIAELQAQINELRAELAALRTERRQ